MAPCEAYALVEAMSSKKPQINVAESLKEIRKGKVMRFKNSKNPSSMNVRTSSTIYKGVC
jgi:hypothetical protein